MRAVYKCEEIPYLTLSAETFNPLYGYAEGIDGGLVREEIWRLPCEAYSIQFNDGLAEVTDPEDIKAMRAYIESRHDSFITEVSFEGNEADLYEPVEVAPEEIKEKPNHDEGIDYNSLSDWDKEMLSRMSK